ncbi:MAG: RsmD family RNA methyltransferase [Clostridiales bacterium]|nr:RsmD family RNA methyltransferase [Clostridiales bacterium]
MRIISGTHKGRRLYWPSDKNVRPTSDRTKEALFGIIQFEIRGADVLDLFSGSGALGLEALSRGANRVVFADADTRHVKKNLSLFSELNTARGNGKTPYTKENSPPFSGTKSGVAAENAGTRYGDGSSALADGARAEVLEGDFVRALKKLADKGDRFDFIFLDPPYASGSGEEAVGIIARRGLLKTDGKIIFEHFYLKGLKDLNNYVTIYDKRIYGTQALSFMRLKDGGGEACKT